VANIDAPDPNGDFIALLSIAELAESRPGFERWEAKCLLCAWRSGGTAPVCLEERSNDGDWDALEHGSQVALKKRRVEEREPRTISASSLGSGKRDG
jgi:hypothetical protein